jgi:hypothetical protein
MKKMRDIHELFFGDEQFMDITGLEFIDKLSMASEKEFVAMIGVLLRKWGKVAAQESYDLLTAGEEHVTRATAMILLVHRCLTVHSALTIMAEHKMLDPSPGDLHRAMRVAIRIATDKEE